MEAEDRSLGLPNGTRRTFEDYERVHFDGYWIRWYKPPPDTLPNRKDLIVQLTRRTFHHTEGGINTPGDRLEQARQAYEEETDPVLKRVNAAMLAGALFNRATDIFTTVVDLAEKGVAINPTNSLLRQCGACFKEALKVGKQVKHYSGHEGIDELWGEPFKAFTLSMEAFYETRYVKIAQTMRDIDRIADRLIEIFGDDPAFPDLAALIVTFADAAKRESETMKADPAIFEVWPEFVAAGEQMAGYRPIRSHACRHARDEHIEREELAIIDEGKRLISYIAGARVPMPKSTEEFFARCDRFVSANVFSLVSER